LKTGNTVIAVSLSEVFHCLKYEIPEMLKSGGGAIVNLSAANGIVGFSGVGAYTAAKHGVLGLTRTAGLEFARQGIRVNAVGPGFVDTPRMRQIPEEVLEAFRAAHPMNRLATREEVANVTGSFWSQTAKLGLLPARASISAPSVGEMLMPGRSGCAWPRRWC
jgi:NAD(P)-dependent dehydrogenase (short-subunit alcohol dehydrogenase family)